MKIVEESIDTENSKWYNKEFLSSSLAEIIVGTICMILIFGFVWL